MPEQENKSKETSTTHSAMDPKKKKIIIGVGAFGVLVLGYLWYKNQSSSSSSTTAAAPTGSGITSYVAPSSSGYTPSTSTPTSSGVPISNVFTPTVNLTGPAGGTTTPTPVASPPNKGGKTHINNPVTKNATHVSTGTNRVSGTLATTRPIKVVTNRNGTKDTAAVNALTSANAARQRAIKSGNKQAIANATANVKRAQGVVASRNRNASHLK